MVGYTLPIMDGPAPAEFLRDRLKAFLIFAKTKLLSGGADLDRLAQLRRLSDVRIRQFAVGRPQITAADLAGHLSDPRSGRFDALALETGFVHAEHLAVALPPLGEEMGYIVEGSLTLQVVGADRMKALLRDFVAQSGRAREPGPASAPTSSAPGGEKPLPPAVSKLLGGARDLWTIPANVSKILDLLKDPGRPPDSACAEIEKAPGLASMVLRLLNAANVATGTRMPSVKRAVVTLGYPATRRAVSLSSLLSLLDTPPGAQYLHALQVAYGASLAARATRLGNAEDHFAAGLAHEIGTLAATRYLNGSAGGTTSAEIGACVLERRGFSAPIVEAARHHLDPPEALQEVQLPREAIVVAAMCRLAGESERIEPWSRLLQLPPSRIEELRSEASKLADAGVKEMLS
jgi:HD-like signal output (HDOD) protein